MIPVLPTKPRPFEDSHRRCRAIGAVGMTGLGRPLRIGGEAASILSRNWERVSMACGAALRDVVEISNASLFVQSRTRGPRVPSRGFVCLWSRLPTRQRSAVATTARWG
jgi:hypothetical protein